jgi:hypothetical protein
MAVLRTPVVVPNCFHSERGWLHSVFRAGSPGFFQKERPRGFNLPEPTLEGCSFVKSYLMVTHQKPDSDSGVHNSSMAYGALTSPASSCSMCPVAGLEGCSSPSGLRSAAPERGWR